MCNLLLKILFIYTCGNDECMDNSPDAYNLEFANLCYRKNNIKYEMYQNLWIGLFNR